MPGDLKDTTGSLKLDDELSVLCCDLTCISLAGVKKT